MYSDLRFDSVQWVIKTNFPSMQFKLIMQDCTSASFVCVFFLFVYAGPTIVCIGCNVAQPQWRSFG